MRKITIGTRGSRLAVIQAQWVLTKLREAAPGLEASLVKITTRGDRYSGTALDKFAGQGVFVKELEKALIDGEIDLAVHSLKDMPAEIPHGLFLAATTARLDPRDALISRAGKSAELAPGSMIGTGSHRRAVQLRALRPDLETCGLRGNIDTRLRKVTEGEVDGIIVAAAALIRLGWQDKITEYLPTNYFTPAVGQGALGIEIRSEDKETALLASAINHELTWQNVTAERTFLRALGGGCRAPIAALGIVSDDVLKLSGMVASIDGSRILRATEEGDAHAPEQVGKQLAQKMVDVGALDCISELKSR
ncbi:MAG: hydroxymethylbilane synthase [Chloroflexi bacterium]|nr:hydroxymethylbilane synthase [Chloroflexota bacterium]MBL7061606.1 hydroxymethylbilane synthase [Dehalococcoidia bacterium]